MVKQYFETRRAHCTCIKYSKPCIGTHQKNLHLLGSGTDEADVHLTCQATLYGNIILHSYLLKDIEMLEMVQHQTTRIVPVSQRSAMKRG